MDYGKIMMKVDIERIHCQHVKEFLLVQDVVQEWKFLNIGLKKANNLLRSVTVSFPKDNIFHGVNVSKLRIM